MRDCLKTTMAHACAFVDRRSTLGATMLAVIAALGTILVAPTATLAGSIVKENITNGSSSYATPDGKVTLTPYSTLAPATVGTLSGGGGGAGGFFGVGTNNAITDTDGKPATLADREALDMTLASDAGLGSISFIWTRANGPVGSGSGVELSGFTSDPGAVVLVDPSVPDVSVSYSNGTVIVNHEWNGGLVSTIGFTRLGPSAGQTIRLSTTDFDQGGAQAALHEIVYGQVPEPASAGLAGFGLLLAAGVRRRKSNGLTSSL
jgi:hypothetical protein